MTFVLLRSTAFIREARKIKSEQDRTVKITLLEKIIHNLRTPLTVIIGYSEMLSTYSLMPLN